MDCSDRSALAELFWFLCGKCKADSKNPKISLRFLANFPTHTKFTAGIFLFVAMFLLRTQFSSSISFVALWVFLSPVLFIFILKMNKAF